MKSTLEAFGILFLSPGSVIGFIIGFLVLMFTGWKPSFPLWALAFFLHLPTLIFLSAFLQTDHPTTGMIVSTLFIYFWGTAGLGFALVLWLIIPASVRSGISRSKSPN